MVDVVDNFAGIGFRWCLCDLVGNTLFSNAVGAVHLGFCMLVSIDLLAFPFGCLGIECMTLGKEGQDLGEAFVSRALAFIDRHSGQCSR